MTLREATMTKHKMAEQMPFNKTMLEGNLTKEQYVNYLASQYNIFSTIENRCSLPDNMLRADKILDDLLELGENNLFAGINTKTEDYCDYLKNNQTNIWPHVYLNYLAIAFGGQIFKTKIPGSGKMYDFENMQETIKYIRNIQSDEWADEVNRGYDFLIEIFDELYKSNI